MDLLLGDGHRSELKRLLSYDHQNLSQRHYSLSAILSPKNFFTKRSHVTQLHFGTSLFDKNIMIIYQIYSNYDSYI